MTLARWSALVLGLFVVSAPWLIGEGAQRFLSEAMLMLAMAEMWNLVAGYAVKLQELTVAENGEIRGIEQRRALWRYLECFASTKSEIVVTVIHEGKVVGEIDIDGDVLNAYSSIDREFLEAVASKIAPLCKI